MLGVRSMEGLAAILCDQPAAPDQEGECADWNDDSGLGWRGGLALNESWPQEGDADRYDLVGAIDCAKRKLDEAEDDKERPQPLVLWRWSPEAQHERKQDDEYSDNGESDEQVVHWAMCCSGRCSTGLLGKLLDGS